ncbi:phosphoenolpyruvate--protein phosphotransferase [Shewanella sp. OPT22]|nr:phosphoenolpyruvate--protein phosphotransferase [Shewanella sp. OPT22]
MTVSGVVVSTGVAIGQAVHIIEQDASVDFKTINLAGIKEQQQKVSDSILELTELLVGGQKKLPEDSENYDLIEADILLLNDDELLETLNNEIKIQRYTASMAVSRVFEQHAIEVESIPDPSIASRADDIRALAKRLIATINGTLAWDMSFIFEPSIILAHDITPAEFAMLPFQHVKAIVLQTGGLTSHTAILARAAGIPALLNCDYTGLNINNGQQIAVDAINGLLYKSPSEDDLKGIKLVVDEERKQQKQLAAYKDQKAVTIDGQGVTIYANAGSLSEITRMSDLGSDGVGLLRTEFMLLNSLEYPCENTQLQHYCDALHQLSGLPLTIRTLDIGADKDVAFFRQADEENPALGIRGCRFSLKHHQYFKPQLKAALRSANHGSVRLMFPMVNQVEELEDILVIIESCKEELSAQGLVYKQPKIGIMLETPASILNLDSLLPLVDFVSIGTNDLTQYTMAADRGNLELTCTYPSLSPSVLKLIKIAIDQAKKHNVEVSLCGELASDKNAVPILLGLGLKELSVNISNVLEIKSLICNSKLAEFKLIAQKAIKAKRISELNS